MKSFYIKDIKMAEVYGFHRTPDDNWHWHINRTTVAMGIFKEDNRIRIYSASGDCIACLCEMYKNGDLEIVETNRRVITVRVSEEELEALERMRLEKCIK